jgi:predicted nucleic acid-binding protein
MMLSAVDTNILAYAEGLNGDQMKQAALGLLRQFRSDSVVLPVNVLGELFNVLVRKGGRSAPEARLAIRNWQASYPLAGTSAESLLAAADLAAKHQISIWDAVIIASAAEAGCRVLLSEDMQHGFTWRDLTVINPFLSERHPLLEKVFSQRRESS